MRQKTLWPEIIVGIGLFIFGMILFSTMVRAADLPKQQSYALDVVPEYNWTGFYVGVNVGAGAAVGEVSSPGRNFNGIGGEGILAGVHGGYDYQLYDSFVVGLMLDAAWTNIKSDLSVPGFSAEAGPEWTIDASVRAGYLLNEAALAYVLGGYSYASYNLDFTGGSMDQSYDGFHLGAGLEAFMTEHMTAGLEYRYRQYGGEDWGTMGAINVEPSEHTARLKIGYRF